LQPDSTTRSGDITCQSAKNALLAFSTIFTLGARSRERRIAEL
jgi:hypothetical protein